MIVRLDKTKKAFVFFFFLNIQNEKEWLMEMTKNNVIHYSKRIIMDCLFRVVFCILRVSLLMLIFRVWQIEKRWLGCLLFVLFSIILNIVSLLILVSSRGIQSIIGIILICLASLILLFLPLFHLLCRLKDKRK